MKLSVALGVSGLALSPFYFPDTSTTGDAGFFLAVPGGTPQVYGFNGFAGPRNITPFDSVSQGPVTVSGTTRSQVTTYRPPRWA